jgi:hypothetical protein
VAPVSHAFRRKCVPGCGLPEYGETGAAVIAVGMVVATGVLNILRLLSAKARIAPVTAGDYPRL